MSERYFVTGGTGCIGGWVVKNLIESGCEVSLLARNPEKLHVLRLIMEEADIAKIDVIEGDIFDAASVEKGVIEREADYIIHLAAMQLPFCHDDPVLGARVNVEGTIHVFEAAKKRGLRSLVYASSTAVYGTSGEYESGKFGNSSPLIPHSHYGVYKQANEWSAKVYFEKYGFSSLGIRPYVVYGPLRDQGMTSTPTAALKAAVKGEPYEISYGGEFDFQYVNDAAIAFIQAARAEYTGAHCYNFRSNPVRMTEFVAALERVCPEARGTITFLDVSLPFPRNESANELESLIGNIPVTSLDDGIRQSLAIFRKHPEML